MVYNIFGEIMRLRNVKGAQDIISQSNYYVSNPFQYKKNFIKLFNNNNNIELEIGMGKGDFIIGKAQANPNINYIGIEKYPTVLLKAFKKLNDKKLDNLKIICLDASFIDELFEKEISKIYLNFSDPWPKKKHANRRLTSPIFLNKYKNIFKDNYEIEMKTDNKNLFEYSLVSLSQNKYVLKEVNLDLYSNLNDDNIQTEYERKFVNLGLPIYKLKIIHEIDKK